MPNVRKSLRNAVRPDPVAMRKTLLHNKAKKDIKFEHEETIGFKNSSFDEIEVSERLAKLLQVHCALEHLLMIDINLNLSNGKRYGRMAINISCRFVILLSSFFFSI